MAIKRQRNSYDRVLVSSGDDSVAELAEKAHIAVENVSIIASKGNRGRTNRYFSIGKIHALRVF